MNEALDPQLKPGSAEASAQEAINYFIDKKRDPVIQVLGEYIRLANGGYFDHESVVRNISTHLQRINPERPAGLDKFYNDSLGYVGAGDISQIVNAYSSIPPELLSYTAKYAETLMDLVREKHKSALARPKTDEILRFYRTIVSPNTPGYRNLTEEEKEVQIHESFRSSTGRYFSGKLDAQHPSYKRAVRQSEFSEIQDTSKQQEQPSQDRQSSERARLMKLLYDDVNLRFDPLYNPHENSMKLEGGRYVVTNRHGSTILNPWDLHDVIENLKFYDSDFYLEASIRNELLFRLSYLDFRSGFSFFGPEELEIIKQIVEDPLESVFSTSLRDIPDMQPSHYLGEIIEWSQLIYGGLNSENLSKSTKRGYFGRARMHLANIGSLARHLRNSPDESEFFEGFEPAGRELSSLVSLLKDSADVQATISGNPLVLSRFPDTISVFNKSSGHIDDFTDWETFSKGLNLKSVARIQSNKKLLTTSGENYLYLALPQYTPLAEVSLFTIQDRQEVELEHGKDYSMQYEPNTGHYRAVLLSDRALMAGKRGVVYSAGLDFAHKQDRVPQRISKIKLSPERVNDLVSALEVSGFQKLATRLDASLHPGPIKRIHQRLSGNNEYSSEDVARSIRESIYYSFDTGDSKERGALDIAIDQTAHGEIDLSFLPLIVKDNASQSKIKVQCAQAAKLYSTLLNYLLIGDVTISGTAYESGVFVDPTNGLTSIAGERFYTSAHSDTQAVFSTAEGNKFRFKSDLTPNPSLQTVIDAARSAVLSSQKLRLNLGKFRQEYGAHGEESLYFRVGSNKEEFDQYVLDLKKQAAEYSRLFEGKPQEMQKFVNSKPEINHTLDELAYLAKRKPMAAVVNLLIFFQHSSNRPLRFVDHEKIQDILSSLTNEAKLARGKKVNEGGLDKLPVDYLNDLSNAALIAENLFLLSKQITTR